MVAFVRLKPIGLVLVTICLSLSLAACGSRPGPAEPAQLQQPQAQPMAPQQAPQQASPPEAPPVQVQQPQAQPMAAQQPQIQPAPPQQEPPAEQLQAQADLPQQAPQPQPQAPQPPPPPQAPPAKAPPQLPPSPAINLVGIWESQTMTGYGVMYSEMILQPNGSYSYLVRWGDLMTWETGLYEVGQGFIHFSVQDYEPKEYKGTAMLRPTSWTVFYTVVDQDTMIWEDRVLGTQWTVYRRR